MTDIQYSDPLADAPQAAETSTDTPTLSIRAQEHIRDSARLRLYLPLVFADLDKPGASETVAP